MEAQKLGDLKEADVIYFHRNLKNNFSNIFIIFQKDAYDKILTDICFKYFNWRINAKPNTYNVSASVKIVLCSRH